MNQLNRNIYTVSELTKKIKALLEEKYPFIWINGEISNFKIPASGHYYFTLKDDAAQISAVMFRGQNNRLEFLPEDGMSVTGYGRVSVYTPRGSYQIILEYLEPSGVGALQAAFEQLKLKLSGEGLFAPELKKPLPYLPQKICLITSPTGAVVHDMIRVMGRRFPNIHIEVVPVSVQGVSVDRLNELVAQHRGKPSIDPSYADELNDQLNQAATAASGGNNAKACRLLKQVLTSIDNADCCQITEAAIADITREAKELQKDLGCG